MLPSKKTSKQYEQIGRAFEEYLEFQTTHRKQIYKLSLIKGILGGLGGIIGATVLVALIIWIMSIFESVPLLGPFVDAVERTIQRK